MQRWKGKEKCPIKWNSSKTLTPGILTALFVLLHFHKASGNVFSRTVHRVDLLSQKAVSNHTKDCNVLSKFWNKNLFINVKFSCLVISTFSGRKRERSVTWEVWWTPAGPGTLFSPLQSHVSCLCVSGIGFFTQRKLQSKFRRIYWGVAVVQELLVWFLHHTGSYGNHGGYPAEKHPRAFQLGWLQNQLKNTKQSWGHLGKMTEIPPSKKHKSIFSFVTPRQEQTCHRSGTKVCCRQGCVWLTKDFVQVKITEPRAVNKQHWSPSVSLVPLRAGLGSWFVPGLLMHLGRDMGMMPSALDLLILPQQEMKQGLVANLMPLSVLASSLSQENTLQKCILNQVWTDSALQALARETAGMWDGKRSLQVSGAVPNGCRILCSHITIIINRNVHQPVILTFNICSLDCYFSRVLCGSNTKKTKPHSSEQRHEKLQELNLSPPAPQIL